VVALLDDVFEAHGGLDRWHRLRRFTVFFSIKGQLLACKSRHLVLKELVAEGCTRSPSFRLTGFPAIDKCVAYRPDRVIIETLSGTLLASREDPLLAFRQPFDGALWDDFHVACFCGLSIWHCLTAPFSLNEADVKVEELASWVERGETWRRLRAVFPIGRGMPDRELILYFDRSGLQRRTDYAAIDTAGTSVAQYSWAHQTFSGIVVPTLHCGLVLLPDGMVVRKPPRLEIEIFDAEFE
jgi:hypothetical protein